MQWTYRALPVRQAFCWAQRSFHQRTEKARSEEEGQVTAWKWTHTSDRVLSVRGGDTHVGNSSFRAGAELAVGNVLSPRLSWQHRLCLNSNLGKLWAWFAIVWEYQEMFPRAQGQGEAKPLYPFVVHTVTECSDHP